MKDETEQKAEQLLPCDQIARQCFEETHCPHCPAYYRRAVAAALREAQQVAWNEGSNAGHEARYPALEAEIAKYAKEIVALEAERYKLEKQLIKLKAERDAAIGKPYTNVIQKEMLRDEYVRGLEWAFYNCSGLTERDIKYLDAEIDKAKAGK